ncbi:hypothetical protein ON010_g3815 [Phytophthora cinnamomi]|nr:hypothetical protein ON010_g3815 [Phytophthora cinnamomi]
MPGFGTMCLLKPRRVLPPEIPAAVFINEGSRPDCIASTTVSNILQRAALSTEGGPAEFSAHSLRADRSRHMHRAGVQTLTIQFHDRWDSDAFNQYRVCMESVESLATKTVSGQKRIHRLQ